MVDFCKEDLDMLDGTYTRDIRNFAFFASNLVLASFATRFMLNKFEAGGSRPELLPRSLY